MIFDILRALHISLFNVDNTKTPQIEHPFWKYCCSQINVKTIMNKTNKSVYMTTTVSCVYQTLHLVRAHD